MKKFLGFLVVMFLSVGAHALINPALPSSSKGNLITQANVFSPLEGIGTVINQTKDMIKCVYDFSVLGGAIGDISLLDDQGNACVLPPGAIAVRSYVYTITAPLGNGANWSYGVLGHADLKAAVAYPATGMVEGALTGSVTLAVGPTTAASSQVFLTNQSVITAGKADLFIEYVYK